LQQRLRAAGIDYCHYQSEYPGHGRELDGHLPVEIEILPRALRVLTPEGAG
jgi:hypothetical protein